MLCETQVNQTFYFNWDKHMSIHIAAATGDIAETVLLPGDPLRAKFIAENMLEDTTRYSDVRGMFGFTGTYRGKRISVQGTGMGVPSISIYVHELIADYGARTLIRIGTCGSIQDDLQLTDLILAQAACTDSNVNRLLFPGANFAPTASFSLLQQAAALAAQKGADFKVGSVLTTDLFYHDDPDYWRRWADYGILALEMETAALYTLAARFGVDALSILTVSDCILTEEKATSTERQEKLLQMVEIALEL